MKRSLLALALVAVLPFAAQADDKLSYTYVEADYVNLDGDADGWGLRGSVEFGESGFYGLGGWRTAEIDGTSVDVDNWELGVGYAHDLSTNFEGLAKASYVDGDDYDGDFVGTLGAQYKFTPTWGVVGEAEFADGGELYTVGVRASF